MNVLATKILCGTMEKYLHSTNTSSLRPNQTKSKRKSKANNTNPNNKTLFEFVKNDEVIHINDTLYDVDVNVIPQSNSYEKCSNENVMNRDNTTNINDINNHIRHSYDKKINKEETILHNYRQELNLIAAKEAELQLKRNSLLKSIRKSIKKINKLKRDHDTQIRISSSTLQQPLESNTVDTNDHPIDNDDDITQTIPILFPKCNHTLVSSIIPSKTHCHHSNLWNYSHHCDTDDGQHGQQDQLNTNHILIEATNNILYRNHTDIIHTLTDADIIQYYNRDTHESCHQTTLHQSENCHHHYDWQSFIRFIHQIAIQLNSSHSFINSSRNEPTLRCDGSPNHHERSLVIDHNPPADQTNIFTEIESINSLLTQWENVSSSIPLPSLTNIVNCIRNLIQKISVKTTISGYTHVMTELSTYHWKLNQITLLHIHNHICLQLPFQQKFVNDLKSIVSHSQLYTAVYPFQRDLLRSQYDTLWEKWASKESSYSDLTHSESHGGNEECHSIQHHSDRVADKNHADNPMLVLYMIVNVSPLIVRFNALIQTLMGYRMLSHQNLTDMDNRHLSDDCGCVEPERDTDITSSISDHHQASPKADGIKINDEQFIEPIRTNTSDSCNVDNDPLLQMSFEQSSEDPFIYECEDIDTCHSEIREVSLPLGCMDYTTRNDSVIILSDRNGYAYSNHPRHDDDDHSDQNGSKIASDRDCQSGNLKIGHNMPINNQDKGINSEFGRPLKALCQLIDDSNRQKADSSSVVRLNHGLELSGDRPSSRVATNTQPTNSLELRYRLDDDDMPQQCSSTVGSGVMYQNPMPDFAKLTLNALTQIAVSLGLKKTTKAKLVPILISIWERLNGARGDGFEKTDVIEVEAKGTSHQPDDHHSHDNISRQMDGEDQDVHPYGDHMDGRERNECGNYDESRIQRDGNGTNNHDNDYAPDNNCSGSAIGNTAAYSSHPSEYDEPTSGQMAYKKDNLQQKKRQRLEFHDQDILQYIQSKHEWYDKILSFDPLELDEIYRDLIRQNMRITRVHLRELLDNQGIFLNCYTISSIK
jgi:uncharacterized protein YktA (UPF0223 family)